MTLAEAGVNPAVVSARTTIAQAEARCLVQNALTEARLAGHATPRLYDVYVMLAVVLAKSGITNQVDQAGIIFDLVTVSGAECPRQDRQCLAAIMIAIALLLDLPLVMGGQPWPCCCRHAPVRRVERDVVGRTLQ